MNKSNFAIKKIKVLVLQALAPLFYLGLLSLLHFGCQNESTKKTITQSTVESEQIKTPPPTSPKVEIKKEKIPSPPPKKDYLYLTVNSDSMSFRGIHLFISQKEMTAMMGTPDSIVRPMYECGFYSEDEQGSEFYQYFYGKLNFMVYEGKAELEFVEFEAGDQIILNEVVLTAGMSFDEMAASLGLEITENTAKTNLTIETIGLDEHYYLKFKDEKLHKFERWTPC